ncbi:PoNe immunity protein domain-containing protein [Prevotella fusca]
MGLFNFKFGGSKKEQDKPIRDKIKNRKHFEKLLSEEKEVIKQRNEIISKGNQNDTDTYIYYAIANNYMNLLKIKYSLGVNIKDLQETYIVSLQSFLLGFESKEPMYFDILNRVALGYLLNIPKENFKQLVDYVQRMDEQAKPADWTPDLLLWFMLNSRLKEDEKQTYADKIAFPKLYKGLFKLTQISDAQEAKKALENYIEKWYNLNKDAPWYNNHLKKNCYRGYWAWEVAAVAKIMHIDDSDLKDNPYYPYDMVHWEDTGTIDEDQQERS